MPDVKTVNSVNRDKKKERDLGPAAAGEDLDGSMFNNILYHYQLTASRTGSIGTNLGVLLEKIGATYNCRQLVVVICFFIYILKTEKKNRLQLILVHPGKSDPRNNEVGVVLIIDMLMANAKIDMIKQKIEIQIDIDEGCILFGIQYNASE
ncbi:hypothetical protein ACJX0J_041045, partial [Zea mays]